MKHVVVWSALSVSALLAYACGGEKAPDPKSPEGVATTTATSEPTAIASALASATAPATEATTPPPRQAHVEEAKILSFERSKDFGKVDKIGKADGALKPDGEKDAVFAVKLTGPVDAIFIATVDKKGDTLGEFQADSLTGSQTQPNEFAVAKAGKLTIGIAAFEGEKLLNAPDGSLTGAIGAGEHTLALHLANVPQVKPGKAVRVWVMMPDHTVIAGPTVTK